MILVTGGTGLIGAQIISDLIVSEKKIKALKRNNSSLYYIEQLFKRKNIFHLYSNIEWINGDITKINSLEKSFKNITSVYHIAGYVNIKNNERERAKLKNINIIGTKNILDLCVKYNVTSLLFMSSISTINACYRNHINDYTLSKILAEMIVSKNNEIDTIIVNPGVVISDVEYNRSSGILLDKLSKGIYTSGSLEIISASDLSKCCISLMEKEIFNSNYILFSEKISYQEMVKTICGERNIWYLSNLQLKIIYYISKLLSFIIKKEVFNLNTYETLTYNPNNDNTDIIDVMGPDFKFMSFEKIFAVKNNSLDLPSKNRQKR